MPPATLDAPVLLTPQNHDDELLTETPLAETSAPSDSPPAPRKQVVVEAEEIVFKAGGATITLSQADGGVVEIHAPNIRISGEEILSEATGTHTTAGRKVVSESLSVTELLGKLVRIDGQFVKIS